MPKCKTCGADFEWGTMDERWIPLIPSGEEGNLARTHADQNGVLRTLHRVICTGYGNAVVLTRLASPVYPGKLPDLNPTIKPKKKKRKNASSAEECEIPFAP